MVIKDIEWYGHTDIRKSKMPKGYIENTGVIILRKPFINQLAGWQYFDQFQFKREIEGWYIFVRKR